MNKVITGIGAAMIIAGGIPMAIGFGTVGIGAGTIAAGIQAGIGNVVAGSTFATFTSLGMKGAFAGLVKGGLITAGIGGISNIFKRK